MNKKLKKLHEILSSESNYKYICADIKDSVIENKHIQGKCELKRTLISKDFCDDGFMHMACIYIIVRLFIFNAFHLLFFAEDKRIEFQKDRILIDNITRKLTIYL